jgi:hypothetical protein
MEKHITIVAVLNIGFGALGIMAGIIIFAVVVGGGLISGDPTAIAITSIVGLVASCFLFLISIPEIIGGIGLLYKKSWARILMLIIAFLDLLNIPFGTIIGIYTIWVLFQDETVKIFSGQELKTETASDGKVD